MGYYIDECEGQSLPTRTKAQWLISTGYAKLAETPVKFQENLVCVVENGMFDAAAYCYSNREFEEFMDEDGRRKTWLIVPNADIFSGYKS